MSSGSWNRGNGVVSPVPGQPRITWTRTWNGSDSIVIRKERHPQQRVRVSRGEARKVTYMSYQKTKSGKYRWVKRETWVVQKTSTHVSYDRNQFVRITTEDQARGVYPSSVVSLIPNALRRREDDAGLNDRDPVREVLARPSSVVNKDRPPKRARLADNPYSMDELYMRQVHCRILRNYIIQEVPEKCVPDSPIQGDIMDYCVTSWAPSSLLDANDQIKLVNKLREKVIGSDFNAAVVLGELHESVDLIVNSAVRIARYMAAMKRGNFRAAHLALFDTSPGRTRNVHPSSVTPKMIASKHLELEYGWKPLLQDVVGGAEALAHALNTPVQKTYRVSVKKTLPQTRKTDIPSYGCGSGDFQIVAKGVKEHRRGLIARFREKPSIPKLLGLLDPEVVAWELVPFSFIADLFIPLGDWLTARGFAQGLDATFVTSDKQTGVAYEPSGSKLIKSDPADGEALFSRVLFTRSVSSTLAVPKPTTVPLSKALSWAHMTNAVALLISNHGGRGYK